MTPQGDMPAVILAADTDVGQARYVQWLESMFIELRGQGVQWTPDDVERACHWRELGVPLATTRRVLGARIATWRAMNGTSPAPVSLRFYEPAVLAAMGGRGAVGLRATHTDPRVDGGVTSGASGQDIDPGAIADATDSGEPNAAALRLVADLVTSGDAIAKASTDPAVADATKRAVAALRKALLAGADDVALLDAIGHARDVMHKRLLRGIGATAARAIDAAATERTGAGLDREAQVRRHRLWTEALLSEELGVLWPTLDGWSARVLRRDRGAGS